MLKVENVTKYYGDFKAVDNLSFDVDSGEIFGLLGELSDIDRQALIYEVLNSLDYNFIVTPKEVDFLIDKLSSILSRGINKSLHNEQMSNLI